jgi:RNA-directed DNA polymerase
MAIKQVLEPILEPTFSESSYGFRPERNQQQAVSNVVLDELDKELEQRGLEFCRFADDCNIFTKTERSAERIMASIKKFIEKKLKLKVNEDKSKTAKSDQVKFLGMTIVKATIAISKASLSKAMEKVKELILRGTNLAI